MVEKVLNIEYQSTKSYAAYLWVMSIVAAFLLDGLCAIWVLITRGQGFLPAVGVVIAIHLIALPLIRVLLEALVNIERIAKR